MNNTNRFKHAFTIPIPVKYENQFEKLGIVALYGTTRFLSRNEIKIVNKNENQIVKAKHFLVATGAKPRKLPIPGEEHVITNNEILELDDLPRNILFIGGGFISFEFAHITVKTKVWLFS